MVLLCDNVFALLITLALKYGQWLKSRLTTDGLNAIAGKSVFISKPHTCYAQNVGLHDESRHIDVKRKL